MTVRILVYGSTTKGDVVKRSDGILVYGSTTKGGVVKRSDCILVYGSTTKGDVVKRSDCIPSQINLTSFLCELQHVGGSSRIHGMTPNNAHHNGRQTYWYKQPRHPARGCR